jgi:ketosteroid isomerase-like protein
MIMTRTIVLFSLLAFSLFAVDPEQAVREASESWRQAIIKQEEAALQRVLADDLSYSHASGKTQNKAEYIAAVTKGPANFESFTESDTKIRVYGKAAVLTGYVDVKTVGRDSYRVRTLEVYVENNGRWQLAAKQSARIGR